MVRQMVIHNMKKIQTFLITLLVSTLCLTFTAPLTHASTFDEVIKGFSGTGKAGGYGVGDNGVPKKEFATAIGDYVNGFFLLMGALFMVLIIYGGWLWLSARGNEDQVSRGKTLLTQCTIGLGIIIAGRLIAELAITYLGKIITQ